MGTAGIDKLVLDENAKAKKHHKHKK